MGRELLVYRRPKWRPLATIALILSGLLVSRVADSAGHLDLTVAVSDKVPKHLCNRALTNLEVSFITYTKFYKMAARFLENWTEFIKLTV
jgi:hypothetical protein